MINTEGAKRFDLKSEIFTGASYVTSFWHDLHSAFFSPGRVSSRVRLRKLLPKESLYRLVPPLLKEISVMQIPVSEIVSVSDDEIDRAVATLVMAFASDPIVRWMYEDSYSYLVHMPELFGALATSCLRARTAYQTDDGLGVALWLPPGDRGDDSQVETVIRNSLSAEMRSEIGSLLEEVERYRPSEPHWYLSLIGVEAINQGKGRGSSLLQYSLRQCDKNHHAAYLWSSNKQNIPFYERAGFRMVRTIQVGSAPSIYPMIRAAR